MLRAKRIRALVAVAAAAVLAAGCEDLTGGLGGGDDYQVVVTGGGLVLATASVNGAVSGGIPVAANAQRTISVAVLDRGADPIVVGSGDQVRVTITSTPIATFQASGQANGAVTGTLRGVSSGVTSLRVQLLRGGTAEYDSPSIPVTVN